MLVIGLISGTSVDGIDAALVEISGSTIDLQIKLLAGQTIPYPTELRERILAVGAGAPLSMAEFAQLDDAIATQFAQAAIALQTDQPAQLIGSHGQTVFHRPKAEARDRRTRRHGDTRTREHQTLSAQSSALSPQHSALLFTPSPLHPFTSHSLLGYSLQLGRGALIAHLTGVTTVSNFRAADIAAAGQGAPLVSKVDAYVLGSSSQSCCVQNVGGIGNLTYLPARTVPHGVDEAARWEQNILGWDTGPGNSLIDLAVHHLSEGRQTFDQDGAWAASGTPCGSLVQGWLQQEFFQQTPPKSTGRELFGKEYLQQCLQDCAAKNVTQPADILATLTDLTAASIVHSYQSYLPQMPDRVFLCGGGSKNSYLKVRLQQHLEAIPLFDTDAAGLNADFKEAIAFAVLAYWRIHNIPGNLPTVTGARETVLLGDICEAERSEE